MDLPKTKGLFITATDTGVGKTLMTGGIGRLLSDQGVRVGVFKPAATGCRREMTELISSDAEFLAMCVQADEPLSAIAPLCYQTPAAPIVCAEVEKQPLDYEQMWAMYRYMAASHDVMLVEGIGGALVPMDEQTTILDIAAQMGLPTVIVARPRLGTINHTLLTIEAVRRAGLPLAGVVINGYNAATADIAEETAPDIIARIGKTKILAIVGYDEESCVEDLRLGAMTLAGLRQCDWKALIASAAS